ncbi:MAG: hypothetical protein KBC44_02930 [Candidatus Pacebacteria bacterium]|nr:hypothetical protein [Candidatus Paceibacterota bacterium]MBP9839909.1 hypothetical protein [Candidatus Paceibacterota bacterium]MDQ5922754.1 hypothetical protein [Patescibacteria group bacterium]
MNINESFKLPNNELPRNLEGRSYVERIFKEIQEGKRFGSLLEPSQKLNEYLGKHSEIESIPYANLFLEKGESYSSLTPNFNLYAIGVPLPLEKVISKEKIESLNINEDIKQKVITLFSEIKSDKVAQVITRINSESVSSGTSGKEKPEIAILEGMIFGFESCCIEYYIDTRYNNNPQHSFEDKIEKYVLDKDHPQSVLCEHHAKGMIEEISKANKLVNQLRNIITRKIERLK